MGAHRIGACGELQKKKLLVCKFTTLPETNSSPMKIPIFPGKYHQNGGFSMAMLVYRSVSLLNCTCWVETENL